LLTYNPGRLQPNSGKIEGYDENAQFFTLLDGNILGVEKP